MKNRCAALLTMALLLAGCSGGPPPSPGPVLSGPSGAAQHNDTDVMFVQMLIPHHRQGIELVRLASGRVRPDVAQLAAAIESTQLDEVERLSTWLATWGAPATAAAGSHAEHGGMPGTSAEEMADLVATQDGFERKFLNMLIAHQDDAIQLARMETAFGSNAAAQDLAAQMGRSRPAQIKQMLGFLDSG